MNEQVTIKKCGNKFLLCFGGSPKEIFDNFKEAESIKVGLQIDKKLKHLAQYSKEYYSKRTQYQKLYQRKYHKKYYSENEEKLKEYAKKYFKNKQEAKK